jgi:hypothetical protein
MPISLTTLFATLSSIFHSRAALQLENLALRHQIGVLQRSARNRPKLTPVDRLLWVWLSRIWSDWSSALAIVKPETVVAWHRKGFRLFWTWKVRHGQPGRPVISREVRDLIRKMCRENSSWGAPRIHGELLKIGIDIGESSVSKYMVHSRKPPSQTWRTFLDYKRAVVVDAEKKEKERSVFKNSLTGPTLLEMYGNGGELHEGTPAGNHLSSELSSVGEFFNTHPCS